MVKICLDPGHGGIDPGAVNGKRCEKDDVLRLALAVKPLLEKQGISVLMTRTSDANVALDTRCAMANKADCDYFLSIHRDAAGASAFGISAWVHSRATAATVASAQSIMDEVLAVTPTMNRRVNKGTPQNYPDFAVNAQTNMTSALLEVGFVTNSEDNKRFDTYFGQYAEAIVRGLCAAVGVVYKETPPPAIDWQFRALAAEKERDVLVAKITEAKQALS